MYIQNQSSVMRKRFRNEYLDRLQLKSSPKTLLDIKRGDPVLVGNDLDEIQYLPIARVSELLPGKDKEIRLVRIQTSKDFMTNPNFSVGMCRQIQSDETST